MYHAIYEGKLFNIEEQMNNTVNRKQEIDMLKKRADKGAFTCPHCEASLIVKAGDIRGIFFAHSSGDACALTESYETYKKQTARETKQHSVMRELVHDVLKSQEKTRADLNVDFGYIAKAKEKWSYFPDIILKHRDKEVAISILTNVDRSSDSKLTKQIKKRNHYFNERGLRTLWFIEDQELSLDFENRVIHLWESEIDLCFKTEEDVRWDRTIQELHHDLPYMLDVFGYWRKNDNIILDTRSLYYINSTQVGIDFSVHRFIIDETQFPYRAFALTRGYRMSISTALSFNGSLALSDSELEQKDRDEFLQEYNLRKQKLKEEKEAQTNVRVSINPLQLQIDSSSSTRNSIDPRDYQAPTIQQTASTYSPTYSQPTRKMNYTELKNKLTSKLGMNQKQQLHLWHNYVLKRGIKEFDQLWLVAQHLDTFEQFEQALNEYLRN